MRQYFHTFCVIISLHRKNAPKFIFLHISIEKKISASEAHVHILSSFPMCFQRFSLKFGENSAAKSGKRKPCQRILFFASFKS